MPWGSSTGGRGSHALSDAAADHASPRTNPGASHVGNWGAGLVILPAAPLVGLVSLSVRASLLVGLVSLLQMSARLDSWGLVLPDGARPLLARLGLVG